MWFLVRMAFWLSVVSLLLPAASPQKTASVRQVGAEGMSAAVDKSLRKTPKDTLMPADLTIPWRAAPAQRTDPLEHERLLRPFRLPLAFRNEKARQLPLPASGRPGGKQARV
jgi:hypothetical protein